MNLGEKAPPDTRDEKLKAQEDGPIVYKLFVGQVPKNVVESDLRKIFEPFGFVQELVVLRDKYTQAHRGCAFVSYTSKSAADKAVAAIHQKLTLHKRPIQVRYAATDKDSNREWKLFVGMLGKATSKESVHVLFSRYGTVREVHLMVDAQTQQSRGCAFVKMSTKEEAENAIRALHEQYLDQGSPRKLIVKFADTHNEKQQKQQLAFSLRSQQYLAAQMPLSMSMPMAPFQGRGNFVGLNGSNNLSLNAAAAANNYSFPTYDYTTQPQPSASASVTSSAASAAAAAAPSPSSQHSSPPAAAASRHHVSSAAAQQQQTQSVPQSHASFYQNNSFSAQDIQGRYSPAMAYGLSQASHSTLPVVMPQQRDVRGPPGANLFIYNVPEQFTDSDLASMFSNFGNVVSARVYKDKLTGQPKGFGFVSYTEPLAAEKAIMGLNGFMINNKRLKVMHKTSNQKNQGSY